MRHLKPVITPGKEGPGLDDESRIEWTVRIEPGNKVEVPVDWIVEYPRDLKIPGI